MRHANLRLFVSSLIGAFALVSFNAVMAGTSPTTQQSSIITFTHTDDLLSGSPNTYATALADGYESPTAIPTSPPASFQFVHTFSQGSSPNTSSTTADAGAYTITNISDMSVGLTTGTGVSQTNVPGDFYTGSSELEIYVDVSWTIGSSGFPATGHPPAVTFQFSLGGVVGTGGSDEFVTDLNFVDQSSIFADAPCGSIDTSTLFTTPGAFNKLVSGSSTLDAGQPLPAGSTLTLEGTIDFLAKNDQSPSNIELVSDATFGGVDTEVAVSTGVPLPTSWEMGLAGMALAAGMTIWRRRTA